MMPTAGCRIISSAAPEVVSFKADQDLQPGKVEWANYIKASAACIMLGAAFRKDVPEGYELSFDAAIASNVPLGGGLSSSAALEVSMATLLEEITGVRVGGVDKALRSHKWSDHNFMGIPCGIMDQFVSALAVAGTTLLVDCRTNAFETVPLDDSGVVFVVTNTGIRHRNASGAYGERVQQCRDAVEAPTKAWERKSFVPHGDAVYAHAGMDAVQIKKRHPEVEQLRDASLAWVLEVQDEVDEKVFKRARHVVSEDRRTLCCAMALRRKDYGIVGGCMTESHASLRDDYEVPYRNLFAKVSIKELDLLVSIAMGTDGVYGSRMTGGGFGGCTVTLVKAEAAQALMTKLREEYLAETGNACECVVTSPCDGAGVLVPLR
ncbi:unnamed protein product [Ectocarpus sp. CCAP 1310/34]|nr:unnamed protein product [Ectocarpus sp. CCAP 1310/34]